MHRTHSTPLELPKIQERFWRRPPHLYWLSNGPKAGPLFARAEKLFAAEGDSRNEIYAKVGRLRSQAETMSFVDLSRILNEQLQTPIVQNDSRLRLWILIAKGYTDIELDYRVSKRDWLEAQDIAKSLGESQWVTRASGELGPLGNQSDRGFTRSPIQRFEATIGRGSHNPQASADRDTRNWDNRGALAHRKRRGLAIDR
jgi:hypothetical protein